jgi:hypothetical protein
MLICLSLTIVIEVLVALLLKVRNKKDILNIVLVNILTNPLLVSLTNLISINYGLELAYISLFTFELLAVFVEGFIYKKYLEYDKINHYLLSAILNLISYLAGLLINIFI